MCGVATAHHLVEHADERQQPIRVTHPSSETSYFAKEYERVVLVAAARSPAMILMFRKELKLPPENVMPIFPSEGVLPIGIEVGWPGVSRHRSPTLCFFSGSISARKKDAYLI